MASRCINSSNEMGSTRIVKVAIEPDFPFRVINRGNKICSTYDIVGYKMIKLSIATVNKGITGDGPLFFILFT